MFENSGEKNGIILGVVYIIFSHVCYLINPKWLLTGIAYLSFVIMIYFMYRSAIEEKEKSDGFLGFRDSLKTAFLTFVIGTLIGSIYMYLMFNFVDTSLNEVMREIKLDQGAFFAKLLGAEDKIENISEQLEKQNLRMDAYTVLMQYLVGLIFPGFIFALVVSALTKKEHE